MICTPSIGRIVLVLLTGYPSFVVVVGLWGGPYLTHIYGYDLKGRGDILPVLARVLGSFFRGPSDRLFGRSLVPLLGRCIALLNIGPMGGGFLAQFVSKRADRALSGWGSGPTRWSLSAGVGLAGGAGPEDDCCLFR